MTAENGILNKLRQEKVKLLKIVKAQREVDRKQVLIKKEKRRLKKEIKALRFETSKKLLTRLRRKTISPETKARLKLAAKRLKRGFKKFEQFANKQGL